MIEALIRGLVLVFQRAGVDAALGSLALEPDLDLMLGLASDRVHVSSTYTLAAPWLGLTTRNEQDYA